MIFADAQEMTIQAAVIGLLLVVTTILQSWWQMKKMEWERQKNEQALAATAKDVKAHVEDATKQVKSSADVAAGTALAAAKTADATRKKLDTVYEAVNGNGLMGVVKRIDKKLDEQGKTLLDHIKDDSDWQKKLTEQFGSLETLLKGSPVPPGGELVVELHGTATTKAE